MESRFSREDLPWRRTYSVPFLGMLVYMSDSGREKRYLSGIDGTRLVVRQVVGMTATATSLPFLLATIDYLSR